MQEMENRRQSPREGWARLIEQEMVLLGNVLSS